MNLPTRLTVLRIVLTPVFVYLLFLKGIEYKLISLGVYIVASLTDWYDGYIAKKYGYVTTWGKFLDPLADKILVSSAFIAFCSLNYVKTWVVTIIVARDLMITALRSYALLNGRPINTIYLARVKTFVQMGSVYIVFMMLIYHEFAVQKQVRLQWVEYLKRVEFINKLMLLVVVLTLYTGVKYFIDNRSHVSSFIRACYKLLVPSDS